MHEVMRIAAVPYNVPAPIYGLLVRYRAGKRVVMLGRVEKVMYNALAYRSILISSSPVCRRPNSTRHVGRL